MNTSMMNRTQRRFVRSVGAAVIGLVLVALAGCGTFGAGGASDEVVLGAIVPATGPVSEWGKSNTAILKMLEKEVNDQGGINGKKLRIVIYDSGAQPVEAANLVRKLATKDGALAILGPFTSSEAEVAFPAANQLKIPITAQASSKPGVAKKNRPWAFRNTIDESAYLNAVVPVMAKDANIKKVAIAYDAADAVGTSIGTKIMPPVLQQSGLQVMNGNRPVTFKTTDVDVKAQVSTLTSMDIDAIGVGAFYNGAAKLMREMSQQGKQTPIFGGSTLVSSNILDAAPETPIYTSGTYYAGLEAAAPWTQKARAAFKEQGVPGDPIMFDSQLYEIGMMYVEAIKSGNLAGKELPAAREGIRAFMANLNGFKGLTGNISINPDGDAQRDFFVIKGVNHQWTVLRTVQPLT